MPRKATGSLVWMRSGWFGRYWATVEGERKHLFVPLDTKNELLAKRRLAELVEAERVGRAPVLVESFEQAATRVAEQRTRLLASARGESSYMRRHVFPVLGRMLVTEVTKADVLSVLEVARDAGLASQTIVHVRNAIGAVFRQLRREGVLTELPIPSGDELPEALPDAIDDRPKAILSDDELLVYLAYTDARTAEKYRGAVRERQVMALLSRCVGGMRTGELHGLTWARARAEGGAFDALEVVRYKTRRKAGKKGSKAASRQLYPLGDTVLPAFLRYWHARREKLSGSAPTADDLLFPVRRARRVNGADRVGERRQNSTWARALRRDVQRAFEAAHAAGKADVAAPGSRRWAELFEGTDDRRPLWFHNSRNAAAVVAERFERLKAAAKFTGHASGRMLQHYREMAGEVDVVPVLPELCPDGAALTAILRSWCAAEGIDPALVFGSSDGSDESANGLCKWSDSPRFKPDQTASADPKSAEISPFGAHTEQLRKRLLYPAELRERGAEATASPGKAQVATTHRPRRSVLHERYARRAQLRHPT